MWFFGKIFILFILLIMSVLLFVFVGIALVFGFISLFSSLKWKRKARVLQNKNLLIENALIDKSEKQAWLQAIFDSSNVGIFIFSLNDNKLIFNNLIFEQLLRQKSKNPAAVDISTFWEPADWDQLQKAMRAILQGTQNSFRAEMPVKIWNDQYLWVDLYLSLIVVDSLANPLFIGVTTDITDRRLAEQKQAETEKIYNLLVENSEDVIGLVDIEGNNLFFNKKGLEYHRVTAEQLKNHPTGSFYDKETTQKIINTIKQAAATRQPVNNVLEVRLYEEDYFVDFTAIPVIETDQTISRVQTVGKNLTHEMKIMKQLEKTNEMLKEVIAIAPVALYSLTLDSETGDWSYDFLSEKIEVLSGYPISFFRSEPMAFLSLIYPDGDSNQMLNPHEILQQEGLHNISYRIKRADSAIVQVRDVFNVTHIKKNVFQLSGYVSIINENQIVAL